MEKTTIKTDKYNNLVTTGLNEWILFFFIVEKCLFCFWNDQNIVKVLLKKKKTILTLSLQFSVKVACFII